MAIQVNKLSHTERASTGFTHRFLLSRTSSSVADWTSSNSFTIYTIATNTIVRDVAVRVVTASDSTTSATLNVGDTSSIVQFITTANGDIKGTTGFGSAASSYKFYASSDTLLVKIIETGTHAAGTFAIYASIIELNPLDAGTGSS